uniref:NADH-ubiquinone oxidoreductase chain 6 n=1 Tax=Sargassum horneri TaxID=74089 RepID=A0A4D6J0C1_9PHAE|nr:NADH dehydrogenase subunit 6 [Sargassum horneri]AWW89707.1 NADH dehydrogenase subunit 6 [Sargassum horneri]AWW89744.1 NADH dehydrogenase subunit 6 [Sargassum horneri]AWW89781.1 NADH dehydrogenase subunit 6 [Sargassum horneri]AYM32597.1 NADH dehydrogenase subunit 6 [Sargassum horneri]
MVDPIIFIFLMILGAGLGVKVISTQNPVYSGLYLVLLFFLGSAISFLLGVEFMALLFLLVYAGAIAVLVLFVVMMLDVKAVESVWSSGQKQSFYIVSFFFLSLVLVGSSYDLLFLLQSGATRIIYALTSFNLVQNGDNLKTAINLLFDKELAAFFCLCFYNDIVSDSFLNDASWFVNFDSCSTLNDLSYILYSTHAILLIIAGVVLLIAMVGAISLTLQKNCPDSLHKQLGRESKNAIFMIKDKPFINPLKLCRFKDTS